MLACAAKDVNRNCILFVHAVEVLATGTPFPPFPPSPPLVVDLLRKGRDTTEQDNSSYFSTSFDTNRPPRSGRASAVVDIDSNFWMSFATDGPAAASDAAPIFRTIWKLFDMVSIALVIKRGCRYNIRCINEGELVTNRSVLRSKITIKCELRSSH